MRFLSRTPTGGLRASTTRFRLGLLGKPTEPQARGIRMQYSSFRSLSRSGRERRYEEVFEMSRKFMLSAAGVSAAAISGAALADITVSWDPVSLTAGQAIAMDLGEVSGTLTAISVVMAWANDTGDSSWASDMLVGISTASAIISGGGYNMSFTGGSSWGGLAGSPNTGTYSSYLTGSQAMSGQAYALVANGWTGSAGTTTSGTMTFFGINAVPAPGALALLGLAGLAGTRRRRA